MILPSRHPWRPWLLCFVSLLLSSGAIAQTAAPDRAPDEQDIFEAVLRHQMQDWARGGDKSVAEAKDETEKAIAKELNFRIFFVSVLGKDPSDAFLQRFRDIPRVIKKASASKIDKTYRLADVDKATGERGILFWVDKIRWQGPNEVEVEGGYHCDGLCGAGIVFTLRRENKKWVLKSERMEWIS